MILRGGMAGSPQSSFRYLMCFERKAANNHAGRNMSTHSPARCTGALPESNFVQARIRGLTIGAERHRYAYLQGGGITKSVPSGDRARVPVGRRQRIALDRKRARVRGNAEFRIEGIEPELLSTGEAAGR